MLTYVICLCLFMTPSNQFGFNIQGAKLVITKFFHKCPDFNNLPAEYQNVSQVSSDAKSYTVNYDLLVNQDLPKKLSIELEIIKCKNREQLDSCFNLNTYRGNDFCRNWIQKSTPWAEFSARCIQPDLTCPLPKGTYEGRNCVLHIDLLSMLPADGSYYKVKNKILDSRRKVLICSLFEGVIR